MRGPFPWHQLDEVSEQYFDKIPRPWPSAENQFTRMLTDQGFGKKFTADFFFDGVIRDIKPISPGRTRDQVVRRYRGQFRKYVETVYELSGRELYPDMEDSDVQYICDVLRAI